MTRVAIYETAKQYGRCAAFWRAAVRLGLLRAVKLNPVEVMEHEFQAFADSLTPAIIRQVNAHLTKNRPRKGQQPASPGRQKPGTMAGSGYVSRLIGGRKTATSTRPELAAPAPGNFSQGVGA